jgi:hypothetical protein
METTLTQSKRSNLIAKPMEDTEILILVLMAALAGVFYLVYRLYVKPRRRRHGLSKGMRRKLGL